MFGIASDYLIIISDAGFCILGTLCVNYAAPIIRFRILRLECYSRVIVSNGFGMFADITISVTALDNNPQPFSD